MARPAGKRGAPRPLALRASNSGHARRSATSCSARSSTVAPELKKTSVHLIEQHTWACSESIELDVSRWNGERPVFINHDWSIQAADQLVQIK